MEPAPHQLPALHTPLHAAEAIPVAEPYVPPGHAFCVALVEPAPHQLPALHFPLHAAVVSPVTEPKLPPGQAMGLAELAGQYEPAGQSTGASTGQ